MGNYHTKRPLKFNRKGELLSQDFKVLYFYHNRMVNYQLDQFVKWQQVKQAEPAIIKEVLV